MHADPAFPTHIGEDVTVGHRAIVHGAKVGDRYVLEMLEERGWSLGGEGSGRPFLDITGAVPAVVTWDAASLANTFQADGIERRWRLAMVRFDWWHVGGGRQQVIHEGRGQGLAVGVVGRLLVQRRAEALRAMHFPPDATSMGDLELRRTPAQRALAIDPDMGFAHSELVSANMFLDRFDAAKRALERRAQHGSEAVANGRVHHGVDDAGSQDR